MKSHRKLKNLQGKFLLAMPTTTGRSQPERQVKSAFLYFFTTAASRRNLPAD
jgi:hypothetical protein